LRFNRNSEAATMPFGKAQTIDVRLAAFAAALVLTSPALAQVDGGPGGHERAGIALGAFVTERDTHVRLDSASGEGTDINLEQDLGFDPDITVARLDGYVWLNERHRIDATYFDLDRSATHVISETINFGDRTFTINAEQDFQIAKLDYTYAFLTPDRGFLGITGGLYVSQSGYTLRTSGGASTESEDLTAPLPVLGLRGRFAFTDRITLGGAWEWFGFESDNVDGHLIDFFVGADYRLANRFALGAGYNRVSTSLGAREDNGFEGRLSWAYDGMLMYAKFEF
jgi:hypothetical protein